MKPYILIPLLAALAAPVACLPERAGEPDPPSETENVDLAALEQEAEILRLEIERERLALLRGELSTLDHDSAFPAANEVGEPLPSEEPLPPDPVADTTLESEPTMPVAASQPGDQAAQAAVVAAPSTALAETTMAAGQPADFGIDYFYETLSPHGQWYDTPEYGFVWQPAVAMQTPQWRPFLDGHWAYTDYGWMWMSEEPFAWAVYHYGRWAELHGVGWVWLPGYHWAPAWVSWRASDTYIGWAPLPPETLHLTTYRTGHGFDSWYGVPQAHYVFLEVSLFHRPVRRHYRPWNAQTTIFNQTVNITHIHIENHVTHIRGPQYLVVNEKCGGHIPRYQVQRVHPRHRTGNDLGAHVRDGRHVEVAAPRIRRDIRSASGPREARRIERAVHARDRSRPDPEVIRDFARNRARDQVVVPQNREQLAALRQQQRDASRREADDRQAREARARPQREVAERDERSRRDRGQAEQRQRGERERQQRDVAEQAEREAQDRRDRQQRETRARPQQELAEQRRAEADDAQQRAEGERRQREAAEREARARPQQEAAQREARDRQQREVAERQQAEQRQRGEREARARQQREAAEREARARQQREAAARQQAEQRQRAERERQQRDAAEREARARQQREAQARQQREAAEREARARQQREASAREARARQQREAQARQQRDAAEREARARQQRGAAEREARSRQERESGARQQRESAGRGDRGRGDR